MAIKFLLDENLRGPLWYALVRHNSRAAVVIDVVRVGDVGAPACGTDDHAVLAWAEEHERVLVTLDERTIPSHLQDHLSNGHQSPGVFLLRVHSALRSVVEFLDLASQFSDSHEWMNRVTYIP